MSNMKFLFGELQFELTATQFCSMFALVLDQRADPDEQVSVRLLSKYRQYDEGEEFPLDKAEQKSVFESLSIDVSIPKKKSSGANNHIVIGGSIQGSNLTIGNNNGVNHTCKDGSNLTTIVSGDGIVVTNKKE